MPFCRYCDDEIVFEDDEEGRCRPFDFYTGEPHDCREKPPVPCRYCGSPIRFRKTKSGKYQPIDRNGEPHFASCKGRKPRVSLGGLFS
jgi:hypothetical protein